MLADGKHFTVAELKCHDGTPYPEEFAERLPELMALLDAIREAWGAPIVVVSGYRSPAHNQALIDADNAQGSHGVASGSQHIEGRAADLRPSSGGHDVPQLYRVVKQLAADGKLLQLGGIGIYPISGWVHVDTFHAPDGHLRQWTGT